MISVAAGVLTAFLINVDKVHRWGGLRRRRGIIQKPSSRTHTNYKVPASLAFLFANQRDRGLDIIYLFIF